MLAPVTIISPLASFRRHRVLPFPGQVNVRMDQRVNATDVIAEGDLPGNHIQLDVSRALGISTSEQLAEVIERSVGDVVEAGDIIAQAPGFVTRAVRAPQKGKIVSIRAGKVMLEVSSPKLAVTAGFPGVVVEIIQDRGAVISVNGTLVQGVWGNNRCESGLLVNTSDAADSELRYDQIDVTLRGSVLLAGTCQDEQVLRAAATLPIRGLVVGSLAPALISTALKMTYPILVLEGFGRIPINSRAYRLLSTNIKREVFLSANAQNSETGERPELFISLPAEGTPVEDVLEFDIGQTVRLVMPPHCGQIGTIEKLFAEGAELSNRLHTPAAEVRLENHQKMLCPLANLDVLI